MSHDIRNFNQVSMGYMEMLELSEDLSEGQRAYLEKALGGVRGSNKLIDDIKRVRMVRETGGNNIMTMDLGKMIDEDIQYVIKAHEGQRIVINQERGQRPHDPVERAGARRYSGTSWKTRSSMTSTRRK